MALTQISALVFLWENDYRQIVLFFLFVMNTLSLRYRRCFAFFATFLLLLPSTLVMANETETETMTEDEKIAQEIHDELEKMVNQNYSCLNNTYTLWQEKIMKILHDALEERATILDALSPDSTMNAMLSKHRSQSVWALADSLSDTYCHDFETMIDDVISYARMLSSAKSFETWNAKEAATDAMLTLQGHILSLRSNVISWEEALSSENTMSIDLALDIPEQDTIIDIQGDITVDSILDVSAVRMESDININAQWDISLPYEYDWETDTMTQKNYRFDSMMAGSFVMMDQTFYMQPQTFVLGVDDPEIAMGEAMVQELIKKMNGAYIMISWDEAQEDILRDFQELNSLSLWNQRKIKNILATQPIFDYYHQEGNTYYGVIGEGLCEIVGIIAPANDWHNAKEECLNDRAKMLLQTQGKGVFFLTINNNAVTWGITDRFANEALSSEMNEDDFASQVLDTDILWRNDTRLTTVTIPFEQTSASIAQWTTNGLFYDYPNLAVKYIEDEQGESYSTMTNIDITGSITADMIQLDGSLDNTDISSRSQHETSGDMSLMLEKTNNGYTSMMTLNGQQKDLETNSMMASFSLSLGSEQSLSTNNVPAITAPNNTITLLEAEALADEVEEMFRGE